MQINQALSCHALFRVVRKTVGSLAGEVGRVDYLYDRLKASARLERESLHLLAGVLRERDMVVGGTCRV